MERALFIEKLDGNAGLNLRTYMAREIQVTIIELVHGGRLTNEHMRVLQFGLDYIELLQDAVDFLLHKSSGIVRPYWTTSELDALMLEYRSEFPMRPVRRMGQKLARIKRTLNVLIEQGRLKHAHFLDHLAEAVYFFHTLK